MNQPRTNSSAPSDRELYAAVIQHLRSTADSYPEPIRTNAQQLIAELATGEFSRIVTLLPYWLQDLLPVPTSVCFQLSVAHIYGWWYYWTQDEIIDESRPPAMLLTGHLALQQMLEIYAQLGLPASPCWPHFNTLAITSANAYTQEVATRFQAWDELTVERLQTINSDLVIARSAAFYFNSLAQAQLAGFPPEHPLTQAVQTSLRCFSALRQIVDDSSDWLDDLEKHQINPVAARVISALYAQKRVRSATDLDVERLAGYQIYAEDVWTELEHEAQRFADTALATLAPFGPSRLQGLIARQLETNATYWATTRAARTQLRALFG